MRSLPPPRHNHCPHCPHCPARLLTQPPFFPAPPRHHRRRVRATRRARAAQCAAGPAARPASRNWHERWRRARTGRSSSGRPRSAGTSWQRTRRGRRRAYCGKTCEARRARTAAARDSARRSCHFFASSGCSSGGPTRCSCSPSRPWRSWHPWHPSRLSRSGRPRLYLYPSPWRWP